jgi:hypothetical protein
VAKIEIHYPREPCRSGASRQPRARSVGTAARRGLRKPNAASASASSWTRVKAVSYPGVPPTLLPAMDPEGPDRWLSTRPDAAANLLVVVVMITADANEIAIHAMLRRDKYAKLLES